MKSSHSRLTTWQTCPRQYYYTYIENIVGRRDAVPLIVGDAVHRGLAAYYSSKSLDDIKRAAGTAFYEVRAKTEWSEPELEDLKLQQEYVEDILGAYSDFWGPEKWVVLAPEVQGHVELGPHLFFFRADLFVSWEGHPWLVEHKTTSQLGDMYFMAFKNDGQVTAYNYCVWKKLGSRPVGTILNIIRKSKKLDRADYQRDVVMRSERQVLDYMTEVEKQLDMLDTLILCYSKGANPKLLFPMHTKECVRFNRVCDYTELCLDDRPAARALFLPRELDYVDLGG